MVIPLEISNKYEWLALLAFMGSYTYWRDAN